MAPRRAYDPVRLPPRKRNGEAAKPDPSIFLEALRQLGNPTPGEVLFIGDNPEADIGGAQAVGMATAWIRRGRQWPASMAPPDFIVDSILETRRLLAL